MLVAQAITLHWATGAQESVELTTSRAASRDANHWVTQVLKWYVIKIRSRDYVGVVSRHVIVLGLSETGLAAPSNVGPLSTPEPNCNELPASYLATGTVTTSVCTHATN